MVTYLFCIMTVANKLFCVPVSGYEECYRLKQEAEELAWQEGREMPHLQCKLPEVYTLKRGQFVDLKKEYHSNAN